MSAPLDDLVVVEIDNWMASPSAGAILADLGATVIKIEPHGGDAMRGDGRRPKVDGPAGHYDFQFDVDNRGKQSIRVDLSSVGGQQVIHRLIGDARIFMCNLLPDRQHRFRLDPDTLFAINPALVHATVTGYGTSGPDAARPGFDVTAYFARSGMFDALRESDQAPVPGARPAQGDHTTGLAFVAGILAALRLAERTGIGQTVETSLFEAAVWTQAVDYSAAVIDRAPVRKRARHELFMPTCNRYPCGDGQWLVLHNPEPAAWTTFCEAIDREQWLSDPRYQDPAARFRQMHELVPLIDEALSHRNRDAWGEIFDAAELIWAPVLAIHEVVDDPQASAIGLFPVLHDEAIGDYRTLNIPMRFSPADVRPRGPAPAPGQHTCNVLAQAGFTGAEIAALFEAGTVS